ncbi:MAG TPA: TIGR02584 family CRISPR-associated protein [Candidatus Aminicenantes bacterium]|nr:MAG: TIGR02584 family CRISPR-associated protein [Candidatus Aminicenantes bacterium]HEK86300.1 TIGR02584 family CRISPR-associated protein [Candidatus Aminicenantes bacterium]
MGRWKEVFVFVVGTSPQIITETIYSLGTSKPPVFPDEIYVITTAAGKKFILEMINKNILEQLIKEYKLPTVEIKEQNILVPIDQRGREIEDICSYEENELIGDLITSFIKEKCQDPKICLHCSIAGGRKTMSFYLGAALQLFGRPWDKLYHVIVSPEFESNPDFFYKPKKDKKLIVRGKDGQQKEVSTREAKLILADLPFIRLGPKINLKSKSFRELVQEGQREIDLFIRQPNLSVDLKSRSISIDHEILTFSPMMMFIYVSFLNLKKEACPCPDRAYCGECRDCYQELGDLFSADNLKRNLEKFSFIFGAREWKRGEILNKWSHGLPAEVCRQYISKLNREIRESLRNEVQAALIEISSVRIYASSRYGLKLEKSKIAIN